jgi:hypothetical protein
MLHVLVWKLPDWIPGSRVANWHDSVDEKEKRQKSKAPAPTARLLSAELFAAVMSKNVILTLPRDTCSRLPSRRAC